MSELKEISVYDIVANPYQPRTQFDKDALNELSLSIMENGLIQPIVVRMNLNGKYEIVAGERRFRAAIQAGFQKVPCLVSEYTDLQSREIALIENIQRENLSPIEEAEAYQALLDITEETQSQLALRVGKKQSTIANKLRLLKLPEEVKDVLRNHQITERHARAMLSMTNVDDMLQLTKQIVDESMTVADTEKKVKAMVKARKPRKKVAVLTSRVKLAINTIKQATAMIKQTGIDLKVTEDNEDDDFYTMTIKIPKK